MTPMVLLHSGAWRDAYAASTRSSHRQLMGGKKYVAASSAPVAIEGSREGRSEYWRAAKGSVGREAGALSVQRASQQSRHRRARREKESGNRPSRGSRSIRRSEASTLA